MTHIGHQGFCCDAPYQRVTFKDPDFRGLSKMFQCVSPLPSLSVSSEAEF